MKRETLKVTWKMVRRKGLDNTRTPKTYCSYVVENENRKHRLKTFLGTHLFDLLDTTYVAKRGVAEVQMDGVYVGDELIYVCNFRKTK